MRGQSVSKTRSATWLSQKTNRKNARKQRQKQNFKINKKCMPKGNARKDGLIQIFFLFIKLIKAKRFKPFIKLFHIPLFSFLCHRVKINCRILCILFWPNLIFVTTTISHFTWESVTKNMENLAQWEFTLGKFSNNKHIGNTKTHFYPF